MPSTYIIHGTHISENLLHHKASDVRRILEDKGFAEKQDEGDKENCHFYPTSGAGMGSQQTTVRFGEGDFVLEEGGVTLAG